jgi:hypothetical protein
MGRRTRSVALGLAVVVLAAVLTSCGSDSTGDDRDAQASAAADYLVEVVDTIDPVHQAFLYFLYRNWGWSQFADLGDRAAEGTRAIQAAGPADTLDFEILAVARVPLPDERQPVETDDGPEVSDTTQVLAAALYCDTQPVSDADTRLMERLVAEGDYGATHVLLAWLWDQELGCDDPALARLGPPALKRVSDDFTGRLASAGADLSSVVDDLSIEQAAFLVQAGQWTLLTDEWVAAVRATQRNDGGWPQETEDRSRSAWHTTILALWMLSAVEGPGVGAPMVRA